MNGIFYSCVIGFFSILTNELGDRTFLLTALFCSRNSFWKVFPACMAALLLNCVASIAFGRFLLPYLLEDILIDVLSSFLLLISGLWIVWTALRDLIVELEDRQSESRKELECEENQVELFRIFVIIFLAELGDRSQLATLALSASHVRARNCAELNELFRIFGAF